MEKNKLYNIEEFLSAIVLLIMLVITFSNVIGRKFLNSSISFSEEITTSLFVLLTTLGTAIAIKRDTHLGLSFFTEKFSFKAQKASVVFGNSLGLLFSIILFFTGINMAYSEYILKQISITLQWPEWIYGSFVPFGAIFMIIRFAQALHKSIKKEACNI